MTTLSSFNGFPRQINGIAHPMIADMYLKKDYRRGERYAQDVLVIEAKGGDEDSEDSFLDLLTDLEDIKGRVERQVGPFHRVDIRTRH